jgi:hypothetical protein
MTKLVPVDFACNDPDSGLFNCKVDTAEIDGNEIERGSQVTFRETAKGFRIHRKEFACEDRKDWVGNWCWNRYWLTVPESNRLVYHLRDNGWHCTTGELRFRSVFNGETP